MIELDEEYLKVTANISSGTTAIICIVEKCNDQPDKAYKVTVCHIGDSRLYIGKKDKPSDFILTTEDHKPTKPSEKARILSAGGFVINGRVDSLLGVSRALGDHCYKSNKGLPPDRQKIIGIPDIRVSYVGKDDYLFLCCDGIVEPRNFVKEGVGIFQFIHERFQHSMDTAQILSELIRKLLQSGSRDNMTAMIVEFRNGQDYNCGSEFIAGEYYEEYGNPSYVNAYKSSCELVGKTIDEVKGLWNTRKELERKKEETETKKND